MTHRQNNVATCAEDDNEDSDEEIDLHSLTLYEHGQDESLQIALRDVICRRINQDWKRLGRTLGLSADEVDAIDANERNTHEKAYSMLGKVNGKFGELKLDAVVDALGKINRNNSIQEINCVLNDDNFNVFEIYNIPNAQVQGHNEQNAQSPALLVTEIEEHELLDIAQSLDSIHTPNFSRLAQEFGFDRKEVDSLDRAYAGGGNPSEKFFEHLEQNQPSVTLGQIRQHCERMKRMDIAGFIEDEMNRSHELNDNVPLKQLEYIFHENLVSKFASSASMGGDWRGLAGYFKYKMTEVNQIENSIRDKHIFSPSQLLFKMLVAKRPDLTLAELSDKCSLIRRMDIVCMIEKIVEKRTGQARPRATNVASLSRLSETGYANEFR